MNDQLEVALRGRKFKRCMEHMFDAVRENYGLRQIEVELMAFLRREPEASASEISRRLELNKGQVSQGFDRLCRLGYLKEATDPDDKRFRTYSITENGKQLIAKADEIRLSASKKMLEGIPEKDLACAEHVFEQVLDNIERMMADTPCLKQDINEGDGEK